MSRRRAALPFLAMALVLGAVLLLVHLRTVRAVTGTSQANCFGDLNAAPYSTGFQSANFSSLVAASINPGGPPTGGVQLNTSLAPFDPEKIVLPFDQDLQVQSVYNNAGATHTMGWFYLDQIEPTYFDPVTQTLVDANGDGVPDLYATLYTQSAGSPMLLSASLSYSDGGNYPHIPNLLEPAPIGIGNLVFQIMNDNGATGWTATYGGVNTSPIQDVSSVVDGIFDYDSNGDGSVDEPDRTVDIGVIQGNREIVFFLVVYYPQTGKNATYGLAGAGTQDSGITVHFSKTVLNTDVGGATANDTVSYVDIGAAGVKSTGNVCETATAATTAGGVPTPLAGTTIPCGNTPYPTWVNNDARLQTKVFGWLSQTAINRLDTATYNNLVLPHEVHRVTAGANGTVPHTFVGAPSTDPDRWIVGFEDLLGYTAASCAGCTHSDFSLEDVVVLVQRTNGGEVVSNLVSTDIPASHQTDTTISKLRVRYSVSFPSPGCDGVSGAAVRVYYSVDNKVTWTQVPFTTNPGDLTIDVLGAGQIGNQLYWKADFVSPTQACEPVLNDLEIGYEAVEHGEFRFAPPIPLSNVVYAGSLETPPFPAAEPVATNDDFATRGHFYANKLFDPANPSVTLVSNTDPTAGRLWDAGAVLSQASFSPSTRNIATQVAGVKYSLVDANGAVLYPLILANGVRGTLVNGAPVYDFTGDAQVTDDDARYVLEWTRGWEFAGDVTTTTPAHSAQARAWRLGAVHNSAPAITGPPPREGWLDGAAVPANQVIASNTFRAAQSQRRTIALVGAQDGMLHAFDAGQFRYGNDPSCTVFLNRGCYAGNTDLARYGTGSELWAWVPPSQLSQLKNNPVKTRGYQSAANPQAEVDGSVNVEDIYVSGTPGTFKTVAYASLGRRQPFVTAVDITDPNTPLPTWANDFTDVDYNGSELGPSVGLSYFGGGTWVTVFSSGLSSAPGNEFFYILDANDGSLLRKVQLNTGPDFAQANGFASYVTILDANQDGLADRAYSVDTLGRIFKYDFFNGRSCMIASTGETVYAGMAFQVSGNPGAPVVKMFLGGGPNPDGTGPVQTLYHLFSFKDTDTIGTCTEIGAHLEYSVPLPNGQKLWAAPFLSSDGNTVEYATANTTSASVCANGLGALVTLSVNGDGSGQPVGGVPSNPPPIAGSPVSSIYAFDGHVLINTINGGTTGGQMMLAAPGNAAGAWNTALGGSANGTQSAIKTFLWQEL